MPPRELPGRSPGSRPAGGAAAGHLPASAPGGPGRLLRWLLVASPRRPRPPPASPGEPQVPASTTGQAGWIGSRVEFTKRAGGKNIATVHCGSNMMLRTCYLPDKWKHDVTVLDHTGMVKGGEPPSIKFPRFVDRSTLKKR